MLHIGVSTNGVIIHERGEDFNAYFIDFTKSAVIFFNTTAFFRQFIVNTAQIPVFSMSFIQKHLYLLLCTF